MKEEKTHPSAEAFIERISEGGWVLCGGREADGIRTPAPVKYVRAAGRSVEIETENGETINLPDARFAFTNSWFMEILCFYKQGIEAKLFGEDPEIRVLRTALRFANGNIVVIKR